MLLDEPTSGVSVKEKFDLMDIVMNALREDNVAVLFIEHDMEIVERYVSRVIAFYQGKSFAIKPRWKLLLTPPFKNMSSACEAQMQKKAPRPC